jgi:Tim44-like domain
MKFKSSGKIDWLAMLLVILPFMLFAQDLWARAGGGGGSSGGGGDGGGLEFAFYMLYLLIRLPFPLNIIVVGSICGVGYYFYKQNKKRTFVRNIDWDKQVKSVKGYDQFRENNPDFDEKAFKEKVHKSFTQIQKAWEAKDLKNVRQWLSDGVYQRFHIQFNMMNLLKQKNTIEKLNIKNIQIDSIETDGNFDIINVAIRATVTDRFVSELDPSLNSGGAEEFMEYWAFIKKRGVASKDMYGDENSCPNCASPLPTAGLGESCKCEACDSIINSGEFDWILSEITQADDYASRHPKLMKSPSLNSRIRKLISENADFSVQLVEDKASNGYLQMVMAIAMKDPSIMRRFVNDKVYDKAMESFAPNTILFNRIYLNDVSLIGVMEQDEKNILAFSIKSSYQRVGLDNNKVVSKDASLFSETEIILMSRDQSTLSTAHSLYSHNCPNCGGTIEDTLDVECPYCGSILNSTSYEWIITDYLSVEEYDAYRKENKSQFLYNLDPALVSKLYDVRDYAFNNVMVMIGIDGVYDDQEEKFAQELAKNWGYDPNQIVSFFDMAKNGSLVIRMPTDPKAQKRIYKLMEKAAAADNVIAPEEATLLNEVKSRYNIPM